MADTRKERVIFHPHSPGTIMFEGSAKDKSFATMFCKGASFFGLVTNEGYHANGDKGCLVIVMGAVHVGISRDFWVNAGLLE